MRKTLGLLLVTLLTLSCSNDDNEAADTPPVSTKTPAEHAEEANRIRWAQALPLDIDPLDFRLYDPKKIGTAVSWYEGDELEEAIKKIRESRQGQGRPAETGSGPQIPTPPPQQNNVLNATMNELQGSFNPSTQSYVPYAREKAPDRYYDVVTGQIVQKSPSSTPAPTPATPAPSSPTPEPTTTPTPTPTASYDELFKTYSREELRRIIAERNINIDNLGLEEKKKLGTEAKQAARERLQRENISPATPAPSSPTPTQQPTTPATTSESATTHVALDKPIEEMTLPELGTVFAQAECLMPLPGSEGKTAKEVVDKFSNQMAIAAERFRVMVQALLAAQIINAGNRDLKNTEFMKARVATLESDCPTVLERYKRQGIPLDTLPSL